MSRRKTGSLMVAGPPWGAEIDRGILELLHRCAWPCDLDRRASFFWHSLPSPPMGPLSIYGTLVKLFTKLPLSVLSVLPICEEMSHRTPKLQRPPSAMGTMWQITTGLFRIDAGLRHHACCCGRSAAISPRQRTRDKSGTPSQTGWGIGSVPGQLGPQSAHAAGWLTRLA